MVSYVELTSSHLKSFLLDVSEVENDKGITLFNSIKNTIKYYGIESKIFAIVSDNGIFLF